METAQAEFDLFPVEECSIEDFAFTPIDDEFIFELMCVEGLADELESSIIACASMMDNADNSGDVVDMNEATIFGTKYSNFKHDPKPNIMIMGKYKHPNTGNVLICGINTNYLKVNELNKLRAAEKKIFSQKTLRQRYWAGRALVPDIFKKYWRQYIDRFLSVKAIANIPYTYTPDLTKDNTLDFNKWRKYVNLSYLQTLERKDRAVVAAKAMRKQLLGNAERKSKFLQKKRDAAKIKREKKAAISKAISTVAPKQKQKIKNRLMPKKKTSNAAGIMTRLLGSEARSKSKTASKNQVTNPNLKKTLNDDFKVQPKTWDMFLAESVI